MVILRFLLVSAFLSVAGAHASAQSVEDLPEELEKALRQMLDDLRPTLDEAAKLLKSFEAIDDPRYYQAPEVLPNGDIIIRRKPDAPEYQPETPEPEEDAPPSDGSIKT